MEKILYTKSQVEEMQKRPYERQINVMYAKILEACTKSKFKIFVAFSGGKDSTFLLYHVARVWADVAPKNTPLTVVFNDTTIEYVGMIPFIYWYLNFIENKFGIKIDFYKSKPQDNQTFVTVYRNYGLPLISKQVAGEIRELKDLMRKYGVSYETLMAHREKTIENVEYIQSLFGGRKIPTLSLLGYTSRLGKFESEYKIPNKWLPLLRDEAPELTDECCAILKHGNIPKQFKNWVNMTAEMAEESRKRLNAYQRTGCNEGILAGGKGGKSKPMGPVTLQTVLRNIEENNIPIFKHYGQVVKEGEVYKTTGMYRTGCALCGFGLEFEPDRFVKLYKLEPARVKFAFTPRERGGLGYKEAFEYCNKYCGTNWGIPDIGE